MDWVKAATLKADASGQIFANIYLGSAAAQNIGFELHYAAEAKPKTPALAGNTSFNDIGMEIIEIYADGLNASAECDLWLDYSTEAYTGYDIYAYIGTVANAYLNLDMFDTVTSINITDSGLEALTGITTLSSMNILNLSNNSMTSAQVNAIVDDVFDMAITNSINNGTLNITGNDAPTGDSLLAYNALVGFGWNSGTPITEISNRFELEAIGLLLNGNFNQTDNINLGGAGAVWLDTDGTTVVSSPVPGGSLDISACNNWYDDAVISGIFTGSFDGNNHHIYNLAIKQQTDVEKDCGLFEPGSNCQITKLTVSGNIQAYGASGSGSSGGLIGYITGSISVIDKSISNVNCLSGSRVGGFVGRNYYSSTIRDCYSTGAVASSGEQVGGFVGYNIGNILNCYTSGNINSADFRTGGICGDNRRTITNCYSIATFTSEGNGLVGQNYGVVAILTNCHSYVTGKSAVGTVGDGATAVNCYQLTKHTDYAAGRTYAIHALVNNPATGQTFRSIQAANTGNALTDTDWWLPTGIQTLTEAEFRNKANFTGFDFDEVWVMGRLHPELRAFASGDSYMLKVGTGMRDLFMTVRG